MHVQQGRSLLDGRSVPTGYVSTVKGRERRWRHFSTLPFIDADTMLSRTITLSVSNRFPGGTRRSSNRFAIFNCRSLQCATDSMFTKRLIRFPFVRACVSAHLNVLITSYMVTRCVMNGKNEGEMRKKGGQAIFSCLSSSLGILSRFFCLGFHLVRTDVQPW
jgi:hypothetical protein